MKKIGIDNIEDIALGGALLGTGGGGDPYIGKLLAIQAIRDYGDVSVIKVEDLPDDALVVPTAVMGAPTVVVEKIANGSEFRRSFEKLEKYFGKKIYACMPIEVGGINSVSPIAVAAQLGLPLVDGDGMGRAFPELQMTTYNINGIGASPMAITDEKGNVTILEAINNNWAENIARAITVVQGGSSMVSLYPMTGKEVKAGAIRDTVSYTAKVGKTIREINQYDKPPIEKLLEEIDGIELFKGKMVDIFRDTRDGFTFGTVKLEGIEEYKNNTCDIGFQNENLVATIGDKVLATTPDLICMVDLENMIPITTDALRYGKRILALGIKCDEKWRTPKGIETAGPRYFGYDLDYIPIETLMMEGK